MSRRVTICPVCIVAFIVCISFLYAQSAKVIRLPTGEYIFDLNGEWNAIIESYSRGTEGVAFSNVIKIIQIGNSCPVTGVITYPITITGILLKDNPMQMPAAAGSEIIRGKLELDGLNKFYMVSGDGRRFPCKWEISEDGNKIDIEATNMGKMILVRNFQR